MVSRLRLSLYLLSGRSHMRITWSSNALRVRKRVFIILRTTISMKLLQTSAGSKTLRSVEGLLAL